MGHLDNCLICVLINNYRKLLTNVTFGLCKLIDIWILNLTSFHVGGSSIYRLILLYHFFDAEMLFRTNTPAFSCTVRIFGFFI